MCIAAIVVAKANKVHPMLGYPATKVTNPEAKRSIVDIKPYHHAGLPSSNSLATGIYRKGFRGGR